MLITLYHRPNLSTINTLDMVVFYVSVRGNWQLKWISRISEKGLLSVIDHQKKKSINNKKSWIVIPNTYIPNIQNSETSYMNKWTINTKNAFQIVSTGQIKTKVRYENTRSYWNLSRLILLAWSVLSSCLLLLVCMVLTSRLLLFFFVIYFYVIWKYTKYIDTYLYS